jgi:hypothetical protein
VRDDPGEKEELSPEILGAMIEQQPNEWVLDELLAIVAQLPKEPLTLVDLPFPWVVEVLLLQLYAFATFGVGFRIKSIPAMEIVMPIVQSSLFICFQIQSINAFCILRNRL